MRNIANKSESKVTPLFEFTPVQLSEYPSFLPEEDKPPRISDENNGQWFAATFKGWLCFNTGANRWYWYDGIKWNEDETRQAEKAAVLFSRAVSHYAVEKGPEYQREALKLQNLKTRKNMLDDAKTFCSVSAKSFDAHPELLNCICGTLNTKTMEWQYHSFEDYLTKCANVTDRIDPKEIPKDYFKDFSVFMLQIQPKDRADFLQQIFGLCLTEDTREEKFYICFGPKTRNGKSSLLEAAGQMLGNYATMVNPETFSTVRNRNGSGPSPDRADLRAARLLHVPEFPKGTLLDCSYIKRVTGGDTIKARKLHQENIEFKLTGQIIFNTNHLPQVSDVTVFDSKRVVVIPFEEQFIEERQDFDLKDRLKSPEMSNQVFYWCLEGLQTYRAAGRLKLPSSVREAVENYAFASDKVERFMSECTERAEGSFIAGTDLHNAYKGWCEGNGLQPEGKQNFFAELRRKGLMCDRATVKGKSVRNLVTDRRLTKLKPIPT